jgi:hypothetical protein
MTFQRGLYQHDLTTDIQMQVWSYYPSSDGFVVKASLINRHNGIVYETEQYTITQDHFKFWKRVSE